MLRINILCVGRVKEKYFAEAIAEYVKRLGAFCKLQIVELNEERLRGDSRTAEVIEAEGRQLLRKISPNDYVIALCIEGKTLSSEELSQKLSDLALSGRSTVDLVIGGSYGLSGEVKSRADLRLSLSRMTFPHTMARMILCEQLYRAFEISTNGKYHK